MSTQRKKGFNKWVIVVSCFFVMALTVGIIYNVFTIFTIPVTEGLGISRQSFSLAQTLILVTTIFVNLIISRLIDRYGLIRLFRIFAILTPLFYLGFAFVTNLWQLYAISLLVGIAQCFITMVPVSALLNSWFDRDIGLALGITFMGSGIGGMVLNPLVNIIIESLSWRHAFGFLTLLMFVFVVPIGFFVLRLPPHPAGSAVFESGIEGAPGTTSSGLNGAIADEAEKIVSAETATTALADKASASDALGSSPAVEVADVVNEYLTTGKGVAADRKFWLLALAFLCNGVAGYSIINFVTPYFRDLGYSSYYAANVMAMSMGLLAVGKVLLGLIYDRTSVRFATLLAIFAAFTGLGALCLAHYTWALVPLAFGNLLGSPAGTVSPPLVARGIFRPEDYSKVNSLFVSFYNIGMTFTPIIGNTIFDLTGSYRPHFIAMLIPMALCFFLFYLVLPREEGKAAAGR
ncbi:MAG: MFS transporter [Clostridiaceae bacterium]|nr:MFS transporter [Clostridiaceae bacterium]